MARRHESLVPLSQDHYHGLLLAQQIRTTDRTILNGWPKDPVGQASYVVEFYQEHLVPHFQAEEESLFPQVMEHVPAGREHVKDLLNEHRLVREFVKRFMNPDSEKTPAQLEKFAELLDGHIRKEERELFPLFEAEAPPEVLERTGHLLHRSPPDSPAPAS